MVHLDISWFEFLPKLVYSTEEGNSKPLQYSSLENSMERGALVGYSPWGHKESDTIEWVTLMYSTFHSHRISRIMYVCVCVYACVCVCVCQNTHRGFSCFCPCFVYFYLSSNVPHTREPCHAHIKLQKLIPLLTLSRLCKLCISKRVWQRLSYINLNTGLKRMLHPPYELRH